MAFFRVWLVVVVVLTCGYVLLMHVADDVEEQLVSCTLIGRIPCVVVG